MIRFFEFVVMALYEDAVLKLPLPTARPIITHWLNIWMAIPRSGTLHLESLEHIGALYRVQNLSVSFHNCAVFLIGLVLDQAIPADLHSKTPKRKGMVDFNHSFSGESRIPSWVWGKAGSGSLGVFKLFDFLFLKTCLDKLGNDPTWTFFSQ